MDITSETESRISTGLVSRRTSSTGVAVQAYGAVSDPTGYTQVAK